MLNHTIPYGADTVLYEEGEEEGGGGRGKGKTQETALAAKGKDTDRHAQRRKKFVLNEFVEKKKKKPLKTSWNLNHAES